MDEKTYLVDFVWRGKQMTCRIEADSWEEAEDRLTAVVETGWVSGLLLMEGDADPQMSAQAGRC